MIYAYFNDCLPRNCTIKTYANALEQTARGLKSLYDQIPEGENIIGGTTVQRNFPIRSTDHHRSHSEDVWA